MPGNVEEEVVDRRTSIAAAFERAEKGDTQDTDPPKPPEDTPAPVDKVPSKPPAKPESDDQEGAGTTPTPGGDEGPDGEEEPAQPSATDKPPQSWRGPQKAKWANLDPDIRQEVMRREREINKTLSESADARKLSANLQQLLTPYMPRFQQMNAHPLHAVNELLKADQILSTAPKEQRAQMVAKIIKDYDVDIEALDAVLSGQAQPDPVETRVQQLLKQQLEPFQNFMNEQQRRAQETAKQTEDRMVAELQSMAEDTDKYPHFQDVKGDMADIYEIQAKKGVYLSLDQVYNRAIAMNPDISKMMETQQEEAAKRKAAQAAHARAQKALNAGVSPRSAPSSVGDPAPPATDRRATIAAAFDSASGR